MLSLMAVACVSAAPAAQTAPAPPRKMPAVLPAVVARVNGEEIRKEDVEFVIVQTSSRSWAHIPPYDRDRTLRDALDYLIEQTLQWQEAQARGIAVEESEVVKWQQAPVTVVSMGVGSSTTTTERQRAAEDLFKKANANLSASAIKRMIGAAKLWEAHFAVPDASDADVKAFYTAHRDMFTGPFEEAAPSIRNVLKFEKAEPKVVSWQALIEGLKQKAKIEVLI
jgi:hypothetical protein